MKLNNNNIYRPKGNDVTMGMADTMTINRGINSFNRVSNDLSSFNRVNQLRLFSSSSNNNSNNGSPVPPTDSPVSKDGSSSTSRSSSSSSSTELGVRNKESGIDKAYMIGMNGRPMFPSMSRIHVGRDAQLFNALQDIALSDQPFVVAALRKTSIPVNGNELDRSIEESERLWAQPGQDKVIDSTLTKGLPIDPLMTDSIDDVHHIGVLARIVGCGYLPEQTKSDSTSEKLVEDLKRRRNLKKKTTPSTAKPASGTGENESLWGNSSALEDASSSNQSKVATPATSSSLVPVATDETGKSSSVVEAPNKPWMLVLAGLARVKVENIINPSKPLPLVSITSFQMAPTLKEEEKEVEALKNGILQNTMEIVSKKPNLLSGQNGLTYLSSGAVAISDARQLYTIIPIVTSSSTAMDQQALLESSNLLNQLRLVLSLVVKELELISLSAKLGKDVEESVSDSQRRYYLMEQMKAIKKELGLDNDGKGYVDKIKKRLKRFIVEEQTAAEKEREIEEQRIQSGKGILPSDLSYIPRHAAAVIEEELTKLQTLSKDGSEFNVSRTYLEWLTSLPWGKYSTETYDLLKAAQILDEDHYGLKDVKQRILEFIAVSKLRGTSHGKILCLVGPPGVGKTSIGKSIARALNREYIRISVGGLYDVSEIKGHRRTYVGAMPGKFIQSLRQSKVSNPLLLIDEIDKMGRGQGNPAHALLELLDPSQNTGFLDHYLDVRYDASKVLFVCTANSAEELQGPLLDRMELIQIPGYDSREKLQIAKQYLIPKAKKSVGLENAGNSANATATSNNNTTPSVKLPETYGLTDGAIESLIRWYCREAGVRSLEKHIEKAYRKLARKIVEAPIADIDNVENKDKWIITENNLEEYVGKPIFHNDRLFEKGTPPGVVTGLAWTGLGGTVLYIETTAVRTPRQISSSSQKSPAKDDSGVGETAIASTFGGGRLFSTGQMGDVMKESTQIAYTYARAKLQQMDPQNMFFESAQIHMHVPEGAVKKDGPSAGCAMTTALLSLAMNKPIADGVAMTGEISLTGMVLPVGGIREKTIAAKSARVNKLVLPYANKRDFEELQDYIKSGLEVTFAQTYDDVFNVAFPKTIPVNILSTNQDQSKSSEVSSSM